jgi:hypothetical protein
MLGRLEIFKFECFHNGRFLIACLAGNSSGEVEGKRTPAQRRRGRADSRSAQAFT